MKKFNFAAIVVTAFILCGTPGLYAGDYTTPPSPYFVHDNEVFFFEFYDSMMGTNKPLKIGANAILTAQQYLAGLLFEIPVATTNSGNNFTVLAAYAFQSGGDGEKDLDFLCNNNISATHIAALTWYGDKYFVRAGYIYGAFTLDDDGVYMENGRPVVYDSTTGDYFNYGVKELEDTTGGNRLYSDPDITYHRMLFELNWDFKYLLLKTLLATDVINAPAFTRTGTEFGFFSNRYTVMPYFCSTYDVEGIHELSIFQGGIYQGIKSERLKGSNDISRQVVSSFSDMIALWQLRIDANYAHVPDTALTCERDDFYAKLELMLAVISLQCWWNNDTGFGAGGGVNMYVEDVVRMWYNFKYNSYIQAPLYRRSVNDEGYSFEWGCAVSM